jgi:alpha-beta hydrolase superfamily lysophospholipase
MVCALSIHMLCVCGVTEHMGRYDEFAKLLADSGVCVT